MLIESNEAFLLAFECGNELRTSPYGYIARDAAVRAAPTLNRTRSARGRQPYSHVIEFKGSKPVAVKPLESVCGT